MSSHVDLAADGGFVVTWANIRNENGGGVWDIYARPFNPDGSAAGDEILVNQTARQHQSRPRRPEVAHLAGGGFVVTWVN